MTDNTKIEWTDASWNPVRARNRETGKTGSYCVHASDGCAHCYAETLNRRFGTHIDYRAQDRDRVEVFLDETMLTQPLRWRRPRRIFVCSMTDLFGEWVTHEMLRRIFDTMRDAPQHTYQILTKRAERQKEFMTWWVMQHVDQPPGNWWFGISVEDQRRADERIPLLLNTPAAVRWISGEPLLSATRISHYLTDRGDSDATWRSRLDWVVVGGESGPGARPMHPDWSRSIRDQCAAAGVAFFMKQMASKAPIPPDLLVRQWPAG